jgi:8-oxo-dGTP pyrophosphatase MutT (NUDIX family)
VRVDEASEPIPAATLIVMRNSASGPPELLMLQRTRTMTFAAGAIVFPGGRIDADDHLIADRIGGGLDHAAARVAAIRETIEETGIAPAVTPTPDPAMIGEIRDALEGGTAFSVVLDRLGLSLDLAALVPLARWCPPAGNARRFDTIFFVAEAPDGMAEAPPALAEAERLLWADAASLLREGDEGQAPIYFPTRRNLERVAPFKSLDDARADAERFAMCKIEPWIEEREGEPWVIILDDVGYAVTAERLATARPERPTPTEARA